MPQLDPSHYATQIFWLLVTFVPLYLILWRKVLPKIGEVLEARQDHIDADLEKATALKAEAEKVLSEYEAALAEARAKANATVKEASEAMAKESAERHEAFGRELDKKTEEAEERIAEAKRAALENIKAVAAETALAATDKLIGERPGEKAVEKALESAESAVGKEG